MDGESIIKRMTLREKILFCTGADMWHTKRIMRLGIGRITMSDGPHGMRFQGDIKGIAGMNTSAPATCFPAAVTAGASWDEELLFEMGATIGKEAHDLGVDIVLGPGCNIKRNPLCGRNFEYFSEDPYLSGVLAAAHVHGLQSEGVSACIKHFCANNQEAHRQSSDSEIDERALREIYLAPFEAVVKTAKPDTLMCSYNMINGTYASDNSRLLNDILRKEWGFSGLVMSDWGALNDRIAAFRAGCDLCMPGGSKYMLKQTIKAVKSGELDERYIDESVRRILRVYEKYVERDTKKRAHFPTHHVSAQRVAEEGAVLLKNDGILPLSADDICLIGHMCEETRYQGSGSSHINPHKQVHIRDAFPDTPYFACCDELGAADDAAIEKAAQLASRHKIAVIVAGLPECIESEGFDRENMRLPDGHNAMIRAISAANPNTVVVLLGGSSMELPWEKSVRAILYMGLPGQAAGTALFRLLTGEISPSGKLTETWTNTLRDVHTHSFGERAVEYRESIYVGYRYYDTAHIPVRYPFGHGLSYTSFSYDNLSLTASGAELDVTNTGNVKAAEIVQLYVHAHGSPVHRPEKELKGFARVELAAGETKRVKFTFEERTFAVWNDGWRTYGGRFTVMLGASSHDIRLSAEMTVSGEKMLMQKEEKSTWYDAPTPQTPPRDEWLSLMKQPPKEHKMKQNGEFDMNSSCLDMYEYSWVMRVLYKLITWLVKRRVKGAADKSNPEFRMMFTSTVECPMRTIVISSCGLVGEWFVRLLLRFANR